jgi:hypothetical protein
MAWKSRDVSLMPFEAPKAPKISQTSPLEQRDDYEKYSAEVSAVRRAGRVSVALGMIEEEPNPAPSKGWAEMVRKVYEVDPMICPQEAHRFMCKR